MCRVRCWLLCARSCEWFFFSFSFFLFFPFVLSFSLSLSLLVFFGFFLGGFAVNWSWLLDGIWCGQLYSYSLFCDGVAWSVD